MKLMLVCFVLAFIVIPLVRPCSGRSHDAQHIFNVLDYGAVGDGDTDDSKAFLEAFRATCSYRHELRTPTMHVHRNKNGLETTILHVRGNRNGLRIPTMYVPSDKKFLLHPIIFQGPCKSNPIKIVIDGDLIAPSDPKRWGCNGGEKKCKQWIGFAEHNGLHISGKGSLNGKGRRWWQKYCPSKHKQCKRRPKSLSIGNSKNVQLSGLTFFDSPQMHIGIEQSSKVRLTYLTIIAPGDSPNTDGIHTQHATEVSITHSHIRTGDDCISMGDGTANVTISSIHCGPGHGISVGSLGIKGKTETVENVHVGNVEFNNTTNGVRIKTWQGGKGYARNITFENIRVHNSRRPIIIDQSYCDHSHCTNHKSAVQISNITYKKVSGTSKDKVAVVLDCSQSLPCKNITMRDIELQSSKENTSTESSCKNVAGTKSGEISPNITCLSRRRRHN